MYSSPRGGFVFSGLLHCIDPLMGRFFLQPYNILCLRIAVCGGGGAEGSGLSGEGTTYCDGGMLDGGKDDMEEGTDGVKRKHRTNPGLKQHLTHTPSFSNTVFTGYSKGSVYFTLHSLCF